MSGCAGSIFSFHRRDWKGKFDAGDTGSDVVTQEWACDNAFYQRLAPEQWAEECAGLTKSSPGVTFPSSSFAGASAPSAEEKEVIEKLRTRVARYIPKAIEVDTSYLNNTQVTVLVIS